MKIGRNDPCHCGSRKKYKKCCMEKDSLKEATRSDKTENEKELSAEFADKSDSDEIENEKELFADFPDKSDSSPDPADKFWDDFDSKDYEAKIAYFIETLNENNFGFDEIGFELMDVLYEESIRHNDRLRFNELLNMLKKIAPSIYEEGEQYYLSWSIKNLVVEKKYDQIPELAKKLARTAGKDIDNFFDVLECLLYHCQLTAIMNAIPVAKPRIQQDLNIIPSGIEEFDELALNNIIFFYLKKYPSADAHDPKLLKELQLYLDIDENLLEEYFIYITNKSNKNWTISDFQYLKISSVHNNDHSKKKTKSEHSQLDQNLLDFCAAFLGYLRHQENIPYSKGFLGSNEIRQYISFRASGYYRFQPNIHKKKFSQSAFMLIPDEKSLDNYLADLLSFFNFKYYKAAAMLEMLPSWIKFLKWHHLINA